MDEDDYDSSAASDNEGSQKCLSDDDGIADVIDDTPRSSQIDPGVHHRTVLEMDSLVGEMNKMIGEVKEVIPVTSGVARILLHQFQWNKEMLFEKFFDSGNEDAFLKLYRVLPSKTVALPSSSHGECEICLLEAPLSGLKCNHLACSNCWERYLETKITVDSCSQIQCIASGCTLLTDDETVFNYLKLTNARQIFKRLTTNSFVEANRLIKWCPAANCGKAVKVAHSEPRPILCTCGHRWCFCCSEQWHIPVNCRLLKLWLKKCNDDSETSNWINANTKECPKCQATIEKDGGCNHMSCKNTACRHEFCWMCLGPWEPHGSAWYSCNRFDDSNSKTARDAQERSRAALQRYLHYYNRYMNHQQSLRLEGKLYAAIKTKMDQLQQHGMSWIEAQFLRQAVDALTECRRTLMYTYAFAFYLVRDNQAAIFEDNQKDLEMATEELSGYLEGELQSTNLQDLKRQVQDKYRYVEKRRHALLSHCEEGTDRGTWMYTE
ncbi:unnamed protein product, partial [Mesorhabditis spiculigera]